MRVYIPTKGRGPSAQHTYNNISEEDKKLYGVTLLVASTEEAIPLRERGFRVEVTNVTGIGPARQWVLDNATDNRVLMLDDDLTNWAMRIEDGRYIKTLPVKDIVSKALHQVDRTLNTCTHVGIGHRQFANNKPVWDQDGRIMRALGYRTDILKREGIRATLPLMEDFELNLKLLTAGHGSLNYYGVVQDQSASNTPGGCRDMRTLELQEYCARELQRMFPEFVKLKRAAGWDIGERWDVSVQWKKAAKYGRSS